MKEGKSFCFIPAKLASTRLPQKNIKKLAGKELIAYAIELAQNSQIFAPKDIIVSTESDKIGKIASSFGANVPYLRSEQLSKDPAGIVDVLLDFFLNFEQYTAYDQAVILLPTAPLTRLVDLKAAWETFQQNDYPSLMTLTATDHNSFRSIIRDADTISPLFKEHIRKKSQELEPTYRINGAVVIIDVKAFLEHKTYFIHPIGSTIMPRNCSIDIDTLDDFHLAEYYINKRFEPQKKF